MDELRREYDAECSLPLLTAKSIIFFSWRYENKTSSTKHILK